MPNATQMLRQDHKKVKGLFIKFEQAKEVDAKRQVAEQAVDELEVHAQVEEEVFYPAVKKAIESIELVDDAKQEHQTAKSLISQLKKMSGRDVGDDNDFETKFSELMQAIGHHVAEEEGEMFPEVEDSELDLSVLGAQMTKRQQEITKGMGSKNTKTGNHSKTASKSQLPGQTKSQSKTARGSGKKSDLKS